MAFIRRHKLFIVPLFVAAMLGVGAFFLLRSESEEPAGSGAEPGQALADQIRQLATTGKDPAAGITLAGQWLAANPALTLERQRIHYELGVAYKAAEDHASAIAVWQQLVADYTNTAFDTTAAGYKVDDAQFYIGVAEDLRGDRAAALAAFETFIATFPGSKRRPFAMWRAWHVYVADGQTDQGLAMLLALVESHPESKLVPKAILFANKLLLDPEANPTPEARAQNLAVVNANLEVLAARHPDAPHTAQAYEDVLKHHNKQSEHDEAGVVARRMIGLFFEAQGAQAGDSLFWAAQTEIKHGDRAIGAAALARFISAFPRSKHRIEAMYRLARVRAQDGQFEEARALAQALAAQYAGTPRHPGALRLAIRSLLSPGAKPDYMTRAQNIQDAKAMIDILTANYPDSPQTPQAIRWAIGCLLGREAAADDEAHAQNLTAAKAMIEILTANYPDAPQTQKAHRNLLKHHTLRYERAEAEPVARRIIELFPGTENAAKTQMDLAKVIVDIRRDFAPAHELIETAFEWARGYNDVRLEAHLLWHESYILTLEGRFEEARQAARQVIKLAEEHEAAAGLHIWADDRIAYTYFKAKEYQQAAQQFTYVLERHADKESWAPFLKYRIGLSWFYAKEEDKAREAFVRLVQDHPEDGWSYVAFTRMDLGIERPENLMSSAQRRAAQ